MNDTIIKGKWNEIRGKIQARWSQLSGDDLERAKGNLSAIAGLVQQKYGTAKEETMKTLSEIVDKIGNSDPSSTSSHGSRENKHDEYQNRKKSA